MQHARRATHDCKVNFCKFTNETHRAIEVYLPRRGTNLELEIAFPQKGAGVCSLDTFGEALRNRIHVAF